MIAPEATVRVAYVHASGGTAKTTLLRASEDLCHERGVATVRVDGRDLEPSAKALREANGAAAPDGDIDEALASQPSVILVDTFELLHELEGWRRHEFVPRPARLDPSLLGGTPWALFALVHRSRLGRAARPHSAAPLRRARLPRLSRAWRQSGFRHSTA